MMKRGSDVSPSPEAQGQMESPALEDLLEDLYALNKLYGLLQHTKADDNALPQGEIKDGRLDEKSRNLFKKLLDSAIQQALQHQAKIVTQYHHHASPPGTPPEEPTLLLSPSKDEQWSRKENSKEQKRGESHQVLQKGTGSDNPQPPQNQSLAMSTVSIAHPQNRSPRSDLKRLNSNRSTASRPLRDQQKPKNLHKTSSSTHSQLLLHRRPIHHRAKRASMNPSLQGGEQRHRAHADHFIAMRSRQSTMSPSKASTGSTQQVSQVKATETRPRPKKIGVISCQFNDGSVADKHSAADGELVMDACVKAPPPLLPAPIIAKESQRSGELAAAKDRAYKTYKSSTKAEHARREKSHRHQKKRGNPNSTIILSKQPSHRCARRIPSPAPHEPKDGMLKKNDEVSSLRRKPPSRPETCRQSTSSSSYSSSTRSSETTGSSQPSRRINSISPPLRATTSNRVNRNIRPSKQKESPPRRSLSPHRFLGKPPVGGPMRPTRSVQPKTKERAVKEKEGRLTRLKNKLSIVFHHHHHHHLHRVKANGGDSSEDGASRRHRSMWDSLLGIVHRKKRTSRRVASRHQYGHLYSLLEGLVHHVFAFAWRRQKAAALPRVPTRRTGAKKVRWWQRLSRRTRLIGTRRTPKKDRLRLSTAWT